MSFAIGDSSGSWAPSVLVDFLDPFLAGTGPVRLRTLSGGRSNELFLAQRGGDQVVLRRTVGDGTASLRREWQILEALRGSDVPHAEALALCEDPDVFEAPFMVLAFIAGSGWYDHAPQLPNLHRLVGEQLVDALARLHCVDWLALGLSELGHPENYRQRQAGRWRSQWQADGLRSLSELRDLADWLADHCPDGSSDTALIHGDYGVHNVLFRAESTPELVAVLDWETSTIGDPLADLGYLLKDWVEPHEVGRWGSIGAPSGLYGTPRRSELIDCYERTLGREIDRDNLSWFRALGQFKIAVIFESAFSRHQRANSSNAFGESLRERVPLLARHGLAIAAGNA